MIIEVVVLCKRFIYPIFVRGIWFKKFNELSVSCEQDSDKFCFWKLNIFLFNFLHSLFVLTHNI